MVPTRKCFGRSTFERRRTRNGIFIKRLTVVLKKS
jgi:hypothetical protein